jgi:hypothetical protein
MGAAMARLRRSRKPLSVVRRIESSNLSPSAFRAETDRDNRVWGAGGGVPGSRTKCTGTSRDPLTRGRTGARPARAGLWDSRRAAVSSLSSTGEERSFLTPRALIAHLPASSRWRGQAPCWSPVDDGHACLLVAFTQSRSEVVEAQDLLRAQLDGVGCGVFFDAGDALGAGDRGDVVALCE